MLYISLSFNPSIDKSSIQGSFPPWLIDLSVLPCLSISGHRQDYTENDIFATGGRILDTLSKKLLSRKEQLLGYQNIIKEQDGLPDDASLFSLSLSYLYEGEQIAKPSEKDEQKEHNVLFGSFFSKIVSFFSRNESAQKDVSDDEDGYLLGSENISYLNYTVSLSQWTLTDDFFRELENLVEVSNSLSSGETLQNKAIGELFLAIADIFAYRSIISSSDFFREVDEDEFKSHYLSNGERGIVYE